MNEKYKALAFAVLEEAVIDYHKAISNGIKNDNEIYDIHPMWFELSGVDPDWFFEVNLKEGDRRRGKRLRKN